MSMPTITWPDRALVFALVEPMIKEFEEFRSRPYPCPAGWPTIGYGTIKYPDGRKVTLSDKPCSEAEATLYLEFSMRRVYADLQTKAGITRAPNLHQAAALLDLAYNVGVGVHDGVKGDLADSTLLDCFNRGDLAGAALHFCDWNKARVGGILQPLKGLTTRRQWDRALFRKPV